MTRPRHLALAAALLLPAAAQANLNIDGACHFESNYRVEFGSDQLSFKSKATDTRAARHIEFANGGILVDGQPLALSAADAQRARQFERQVQRLVPQVRQVAADGLDIAFVALGKVVEHFSSQSRRAEVMVELDELHREAVDAVATARSSDALKEAAFEQRIESAAARIVPVIAGEFAAQAISAAMSGDEKSAAEIERRANQLGRDIEHSVEGAAKQLEARVAALCPQFEALDRIDNAFEWRLPDGSPVELLEFESGEHVAAQ